MAGLSGAVADAILTSPEGSGENPALVWCSVMTGGIGFAVTWQR
jgi:hypothetical protein